MMDNKDASPSEVKRGPINVGGLVPPRIDKDLASLDAVLKNPVALKKVMFEFFDNADDPCSYLLDLLFYSNMPYHSKISPRSQAILTEFESWLGSNDMSPDMSQKVYALNYAMKLKNGAFIKKICQVLRMDKKKDYDLKCVVDHHLQNGQLKQVCYAIEALQMQQDYTIEQVYIPLLFQDMRSLVISCLRDYRDLQSEFVKKLDDLCLDKEKLNQYCIYLKNQTKMKLARRDVKWLKKALGCCIKEWNIPVSECKNLEKSRSFGAMNYLLYKRYTEMSMNDQTFQEMILTAVREDDAPEIQKELLVRLQCLNEKEMALCMAKKLNVDPKDWPEALLDHANEKALSDSAAGRVSGTEEESWDDEIQNDFPSDFFLCLRLGESDIVVVDDLEKFDSCVGILTGCYDVLGIDAEWRPSLGLSQEVLSLLQIATWYNVYLLDVLSLSKCLSSDNWKNLMENVFYNPKILKLGYGVQRDLSMLAENFLGEVKSKNQFSSVLDLSTFWTGISKEHSEIISSFSTNQPKDRDDVASETEHARGLSGLCLQVLGKPLNKTEQFSDWERRPLRKDQLIYAALDAFCLLQIHEKLFHAFREHGLSLKEVITESFQEKKKVQDSKKKKTEEKIMKDQIKRNENKEPLPISIFRAVVDCCFAGLGKHLRVRGADIIVMQDGGDVLEAVKVAQKEERCIITNTKRYLMMKGYMPEDMVCCISSNLSLPQQATFVCKYFNLVCTEDDVFIRCTLCNCDRYLKVKSCDMELLWKIKCTAPSNVPSVESLSTMELVPLVICDDGFITEEGVTHTRKLVDMSGLSELILMKNLLFFVCSQCGKIYWEGSHHKRTKEAVAKWISENYSSQEQGESSSSEFPLQSDVDGKNPPPVSATSQNPEKASSLPPHSQINHQSKIVILPEYDSSDDDSIDDIVY